MTWFLLAEQERGKTLPPTSSAELGHSFRTSQCRPDASLWISRGCLGNFLPRLRSACLSLVVLWDPCPVLISRNWHTVILQYAGIFAQREVYCVSMPTNSKKQANISSLPLFFPSLPSIFLSLSSNTQFMHLSNGQFPVGQHSAAKRTQEEGGLQGGLYASSLGLLFHHSVSGSLFPYTLNKNNLPRPNCAQTWHNCHGTVSWTQWQRYWENLWLIPSSSLLVLERATGVERRVVRVWVWVEQSRDIDTSFLSFLLLLQQHHLLTSSYSSSFTEYCRQGFEYIRQALDQPSYLSSSCFSNSLYPYSPVHHCSAHFISHCKSAVDIYRTGLK